MSLTPEYETNGLLDDKPVPRIPINDAPFANLAEREQAQVLGTAEHFFFGLKMQQHPQAVVRLNQLLNLIQPRHIVEIGSGNAGLSYLLSTYATLTGGTYHGFDLIEGKHAALLNDYYSPLSESGGIQRLDVLNDPANIALVKGLIAQEGRTCVFADAGKALEYRIYAPSLKVGDFILMHDYSPTKETFERDMKGTRWNWHEAWDERVADVAHECGIVNTTCMQDVAWSCGYKAS